MKRFKELLTIGLAVLLMLCMSMCLFGCDKINHNAIIITDGIVYKTDWLENNYTYGANYDNAYGYDEASPESRTHIIKNATALNEVFEVFPEIDFEKEMVLVYCYTSVYARKRVLEKVVLDGNVLSVEFNVEKGKIGYADACAPHRRVLVIKLDKLDATEVNIQYNGQ